MTWAEFFDNPWPALAILFAFTTILCYLAYRHERQR
jgi:hypothetical protein